MVMLFDLFDEDMPVGILANPENRGVGLSSRPPAPRPECNLVGLDNQGSTCYLNSLIQQLFITPEFLEGLFAVSPDLLGIGGPEHLVRTIPLELQRLLARMLISDEAAVSTADLTRSFGWIGGEIFQQHDVQELNRILFAAIEDSLVGLPIGSDLIRRYYRGTLVNQVRCHACDSVSEREEDYQDLCVPVAGHPDLTSALITAYVDTETMEGDNAYRCERCDNYVTASKGTKIRTLPPILTISLLRFNFDFRKMERYKETSRFAFPMTLDMAPFAESLATSDWAPGHLYDLVGVVIHRGSGYGGHYHAILRDSLGLGCWQPPELEPIRVPSSDTADLLEVSSPLDLLRVILAGAGFSGLQVDKLGGEIVKQTGVSWNKRFRQHHGPLIKFIRRHEHILGFNPDSRWVWLKPEGEQTKVDAQTTTDDLEAGKPVTKKEEQEAAAAEEENEGASKTDTEETVSAGQVGWFDFNDARVSPIHPAKIEQQFEGKESAYILTYRLRSLDIMRSASSKITPPDWLLAEVMERNEKMRKEREEYESRINRITVNVLESRHVRLVHGNLEFVENYEDEGRQLRIDCRKTLGDLLPLIVDAASWPSISLLWRGTECAFYVRAELKECDPTRPLTGLGISNGARLLLWDGLQLNDVPWPHSRQVPFRLLLECPPCSPDLTARVHGRDTPLWRCVSEHWADLDPAGLTVSRVTRSEDGADLLVPIPAEQVHLSAVELGLSGDVHLLVADRRFAEQRAAVTNRAQVTEGTAIRYHAAVRNSLSSEDRSPRLFVPLDPNMTVLEFRMEALRACGFVAVDTMAVETRLRLAPKGLDDPDELGPPLIDSWTVLDSGWDADNDRAHFVLERGQPVLTGELFLTVVPWDLSAEWSVATPATETVGDFKAQAIVALSKQGLDPNDLFLQHVTWCDYTGPSYRDETLSLSAAGVRHGDRLLLQRGRLLPPGRIAFSVRWHRVPREAVLSPATAQRLIAPGGEGLVDRLAGGLRGLWAPSEAEKPQEAPEEEEDEEEGGRRLALCRLEAEAATTVAALRARLRQALEAALLQKYDEVLPEAEARVRLRVVEQERCAAVLKSPGQSIQRARISDERPLCMEVLPEESPHMESSDVLLLVRVLDTDLQRYSASYEFVWCPEEGALPSALYKQLDALFGIGVERFRVAKLLPERHQWTPLPTDDSTATGTGNAANRQRAAHSKKRVSLLRAPYGLRDGDTLGVKRVESAEVTVTGEDFATPGNKAARQRMEEEIRERRASRRSGGSACTGPGGASGSANDTCRRPTRPAEAPLVIHVQRFT